MKFWLECVSCIILMKYLFILSAVLLLAIAAPIDDKVDLLVPGYTQHDFYSGQSVYIQDSLISTLLPSTMCSLIPRVTPITIPWCFGSMEDQAAPVCSEWSTKTDHLSSSKALSISKSTLTHGTRRPTCSISPLLGV